VVVPTISLPMPMFSKFYQQLKKLTLDLSHWSPR
jgi:hypothetical protein